MSARRHVVFVTYTMLNPHAVGVFFRALRLGIEMNGRGWTFTVFNNGPLPEEDPKLQRARESGGKIVRIDLADMDDDDAKTRAIRAILQKDEPDLMVFGEVPLDQMQRYYQAAQMVRAPFVLLDQFYDAACKPDGHRWGIDGFFLYGLRAIWSQPVDMRFPCEIIPPFIDAVTPVEELPLPATLRELPRVVVLGLDERVLDRGIEIVAGCGEPIGIVTLSRDPAESERRMNAAGIPPERRLSLPLLKDADLYGWIAASRVAIVANGFMQMMEMLALGCPAICVDRGIGMWPWTLADGLQPYVSLCEELERQRERLLGWLRASPFGNEQLAALLRELKGAQVCADHLEAVAKRRRFLGRVQRWGTMIDWQVRNWLHGDKRRALQPPGGTAET